MFNCIQALYMLLANNFLIMHVFFLHDFRCICRQRKENLSGFRV